MKHWHLGIALICLGSTQGCISKRRHQREMAVVVGATLSVCASERLIVESNLAICEGRAMSLRRK